MRFLVDECLSIQVSALLTASGHDAVHVVELGMAGLPDEQVLAHATTEHRILLSADTDFGEILARTGNEVPSVILFRRSDRAARSLVATLSANLDVLADDLSAGSFVVITDDRLRIRRLPMRRSNEA